jgi:hypothetical protein
MFIYGELLLMPPSPNNMGVLHCQRVRTVHVEDTIVSETCFIYEQHICSEAYNKILLSAKHCLVARLACFAHCKDTAQFS